MNSRIHNAEHEVMLAEILAGELDVEDCPDIQGCEECRQSLEELGSLSGELADLVGLRDQILKESESEPGPSDPARHERVVRSQLGQPRILRRAPQLLFATAAVALVLSVGWIVRVWIDGNGGGEIPLGNLRIELLQPRGDAAGFELFRWKTEGEEYPFYEVTVFVEGRTDRSGLLEEQEWRPDSELLSRWPSEIEWSVTVYDGDGEFAAESERTRARR